MIDRKGTTRERMGNEQTWKGRWRTHLPFPSSPWQPARAQPHTYTTRSSTLPSRGAYSWTSSSIGELHDGHDVELTGGEVTNVRRKEGGPPRRDTWGSEISEAIVISPSGRPRRVVVASDDEDEEDEAEESDDQEESASSSC